MTLARFFGKQGKSGLQDARNPSLPATGSGRPAARFGGLGQGSYSPNPPGRSSGFDPFGDRAVGARRLSGRAAYGTPAHLHRTADPNGDPWRPACRTRACPPPDRATGKHGAGANRDSVGQAGGAVGSQPNTWYAK